MFDCISELFIAHISWFVCHLDLADRSVNEHLPEKRAQIGQKTDMPISLFEL
jgi:hypothetical protein